MGTCPGIRRIEAAAGLALALIAIRPAPAAETLADASPRSPAATTAPPPPPDYPPEVAAAVEKGLAWLARRQNRDGSFGDRVPVATTSVAGLAFLAHGDVPGRGRYAQQVAKAMTGLLSCQQRRGYITEVSGRGNGSQMHGHGYAVLFLAELLGTSGDEPEGLRQGLAKAVRTIEASQSKDGGWFYEPEPAGDEASITVTQVQALRSARNAGIRVNRTTIDRAIQYIKRCANADGSIRYSLSNNQTYSSFSLTAAGVSVMDYLGEYKMPEVQKGLAFLILPFEKKKPRPAPPDGCDYLPYQDFYGSLALYFAGDETWARHGRVIRQEIVSRQLADGSWEDGSYGPELSTAFATLTLQLAKQYLPTFQR